jgi:hypothetical protein
MIGLTLLLLVILTIGLKTYITNQILPKLTLTDYANVEWDHYLKWSSIMGAFIGTTITYHTSSVIMGLVFGVMMFFLTLTAQVDLLMNRAPKEMTTMAIISGLVAGSFALASGERAIINPLGFEGTLGVTMFSLLGFMGIITLIFIGLLFDIKSVGFADVKVFWAVGLFISWYLGYPNMLLIFILSNILLFIHLIASKITSFKRKEGRKNIPVLPAFFVATAITSIYVVSL